LKTKRKKESFIADLKIPTYHGFTKYNFLDVLQALSKHVFSVEFTQNKIMEDKKRIHTGRGD
jgi:hypothetical protein